MADEKPGRITATASALLANRIRHGLDRLAELGFEIEGGPETAIHLERHGRVLMDDLPGTVDPTEAYRYALPPFRTLAVGPGGGRYLLKTMANSEIAADGDVQVTLRQANWAFPGVEPRRETWNIERMGQWGREIEYDGVRRKLRGDGRRILVMMSLTHGFQYSFDLRLFGIDSHDRLPLRVGGYSQGRSSGT